MITTTKRRHVSQVIRHFVPTQEEAMIIFKLQQGQIIQKEDYDPVNLGVTVPSFLKDIIQLEASVSNMSMSKLVSGILGRHFGRKPVYKKYFSCNWAFVLSEVSKKKGVGRHLGIRKRNYYKRKKELENSLNNDLQTQEEKSST